MEAVHFRERVVEVTLGRTTTETQGKSAGDMKKLVQEELGKEDSTKDVQVLAVSAPF